MTNMLKLVVHGVGLGEEFTSQCNYQLDKALSVAELNAMAAAWAADLTSLQRGELTQILSADQHWDQVSFYYYATTPNDPATEVAHAAVTTLAGAGATANPLQVACCVSTHSNFAGASNRGRMYLPATGQTPTSHRFTSAQIDNNVLAAQAIIQSGYVTALAHSTATSCVAIVFSPKKGTGVPITSVSADNVPDIQRRRAESLTGTYTGTATVTTA